MLEPLHPNLMALLSAFFISVARTLYRGALMSLSPLVTTVFATIITSILALGLYARGEGLAHWPLYGVLWFVLVGVVGGLGGRYMGMISIKLLGLARTPILTQTGLIWSTGLAVILLGETLTPLVTLGTLGIMAGGVLLLYDKKAIERRVPLTYYLIPVVGAAFASISHIVRKYGFVHIPSVSLGMSISNVTSLTLLVASFFFLPALQMKSAPFTRHSLTITSLGATCNFLAAFFFWWAIKDGEVIQVVPINRLSILIVILFSWLFFRKQERISAQVIIGGACSVLGAWAVVWGK